jgi:uncharacterized protein YjiS (DUF1127 family)
MLEHDERRAISFIGAARIFVRDACRLAFGLLSALRNRRAVLSLANLDDRALKDIGLTRPEVAGALAEPFYRDPSRVLLVRSVERRACARAAAAGNRPTDREATAGISPAGKRSAAAA